MLLALWGASVASSAVAESPSLPSNTSFVSENKQCSANEQEAAKLQFNYIGAFEKTVWNKKAQLAENACLISWADALVDPGSLLVDVRNTKEFEDFHIPGAINVPAYAVKTKSFLQTRPVFLVDDGHNYARLQTLCEELRGQGFKNVSAIVGGVNLAFLNGESVEGAGIAQGAITRLIPEDFIQQKNYAYVLVVDVSGKTTLLANIMPAQNILRISSKDAAFVDRINQSVVTKKKLSNFPLVVVVDRDGRQSVKLQKKLSTLKDINIVYLEGGVNGLELFIQRQIASFERQQAGPTRPRCGA